MWRLANFEITRLPAAGDVYLFECVGRAQPVRRAAGRRRRGPRPHRGARRGRPGGRAARGRARAGRLPRRDPPGVASRPPWRALEWNRIMLYVWPPVDLPLDELTRGRPAAAAAHGGTRPRAGRGQRPLRRAGADEPVEAVMRLGYEPGRGLTVRLTEPPTAPMQPLDDYTRKVIQTRRRGLVYPYELVPLLAGRAARSSSTTSTTTARWSPSTGRPARNRAGVVVGVVTTPTDRYPEGIDARRRARRPDQGDGLDHRGRVPCGCSPPSTSRRAMDVPIEWFALSAGAKIAMDSGSENLDWVARVLRRLVEHTQRGRRGERRRRRHQRRRPAVLERRGDDADAHPRHPRDDAGQRDGAHRQAGDRLLRRRVGRGQPRHRRLRPDHGPQRRGAVLGAEPGRGLRHPASTTTS